MNDILNDPYALAKYIGEAEKKTPVKAYVRGYLKTQDLAGLDYYGNPENCIILAEQKDLEDFLNTNKDKLRSVHLELDRKNSAIDLLDLSNIEARIEPGALIREKVDIGKNAVIMMGAVLNIGSVIGEGTMIDMNAVVGGRAQVGKNCHIGAGTVLAGVIEPPSAEPVVIEDDVVIGANAVILEGVRVGEGSVVAAGSVVTEDVPAGSVVAGVPAKVVKQKDEKTDAKTELQSVLRNLDESSSL